MALAYGYWPASYGRGICCCTWSCAADLKHRPALPTEAHAAAGLLADHSDTHSRCRQRQGLRIGADGLLARLCNTLRVFAMKAVAVVMAAVAAATGEPGHV